MSNRRLFLFFGLWFAAPGPVRADAVDDFLQAALAKQRIPGLAVAVIRDGKLIKAKGYGFADVEQNVPATEDTVFQLASVSKQFVAAGVLLLAEDRKVDLDAPVGRYLDGAPDAWKGITVRHLLTHTAGLVRDDPLGVRAAPTEEEVFRAVAKLKLESPPGERWSYSNVGYNLLSLIIQKVSGKTWEVFLQERVFGPLGMAATRRYLPTAPVPNFAVGYVRQGDTLRKAPALPRNLASGGLLGTVTDMARWDAALRGDKLLKKASRTLMWTPVTLKDGSPARVRDGGYAFGWRVSSVRGHKLIDHGGMRPGYVAYIGRFVDDGLTVVLLANLQGANLPTLGAGVAALYFPALKGPTDVDAPPEGGAAPERPGVSLLLLKASAERRENDTLFRCEVRIDNATGNELKVRSNFASAFDGLELVVTTKKGKVLAQQPYIWHQSPFTPDARVFPLKKGGTTATLVFPVQELPGDDKAFKVRLVGTLPNSAYRRILSSETIEINLKD
jgi:CubicO group peptidase (beta-lactamase class C family)